MTNYTQKLLKQLVLLALLVCATAGAHAQDLNTDIYGKWKIKALIGGGAVSSRSQSQVNKIIGKFVTISPERFDLNGQTCAHPNYQRSKEDPATYFDREWRTDVSDIPFPNPVTIIDTGCTTFLYPIRKDHLMIADDGDFFEAVRVGKLSSQSNSVQHR